jgi:glucose-6-phosphate isomerase
MSNTVSPNNIFSDLTEHAKELQQIHLRDLFTQNPNRANRFSIETDSVLFDFSKNFITEKTRALLCALANECKLSDRIDALFSGQCINSTEERPALHTALRQQSNSSLIINHRNITDDINKTLRQMTLIVEKIQQSNWLGFNHQPITDVVNLGIGGSDLGPAMCTYALSHFQNSLVRCHFVSHIDDIDIWQRDQSLKPETTLFIVASKSFTSKETLLNATKAKNWLVTASGDEKCLTNHFIAITAKPDTAKQWGISHILPIWDWVGGRFSVWSAIGLPIAISIGMENFRAFLQGAHSVDQHFRTTEFEKNIPVLLALLSIWYVNFFNAKSYAILPYDQLLQHLPAYLQQLEMESNGKYCRHNGQQVNYATSPVIWGEVGSNGQHAFHQLLHQGTQFIPIDFVLAATNYHAEPKHHAWMVASCLSQSKALMLGRTEAEVRLELEQQHLSEDAINKLLPHKILIGNRPSNTLLLPTLNPYNLGALLALYEHKVFVQSVIWDINCFDQWGVELGKQFTEEIFQQLCDGKSGNHDSSTTALINYYKSRL